LARGSAGAGDDYLLQLKEKVLVLVTTVAANAGRIKLHRQVYKNDSLAKDLFVFVSDAEDSELGTSTVPQCSGGSWLQAKCCR
jgi:hypothetical protein